MNEGYSPAIEPALAAANVTGKRIVAALIDVIILLVVFVIFAALWGETDDQGPGRRDTETTGFTVYLGLGASAGYFLVVYAYYNATEAVMAATPGKLALGLRVARLDGGRPSIGQTIARNIIRIVDGLPFLYLVGIISIAVTKRGQRLGDLAAGTVVVASRHPNSRYGDGEAD